MHLEDARWRLKSKATWLEEGDNNTMFFRRLVENVRVRNTIWELENSQGESISSPKDLEPEGVAFLESLFKDSVGS